VVERAWVESCFGQADWPESVLIRATCNIIFGGAHKDIVDASSGTIALSFRVAIAGRYMASLRHELHAGTRCMRYHHAPIRRELPHVCSKISISPRQLRHCFALFCYAHVMAWRSLFEARLNGCFC
jgi:hypothetical protein